VRRLRKRPRKSAVAFADQALTPSQSKRKTAPHTKATKGSAFFDSIGQTRKSALVTAVSAFAPLAAKLRTSLEVSFVPILLQKWVAPMGGRPFHYEWPALIGRR
jgi:hypothetical protein